MQLPSMLLLVRAAIFLNLLQLRLEDADGLLFLCEGGVELLELLGVLHIPLVHRSLGILEGLLRLPEPLCLLVSLLQSPLRVTLRLQNSAASQSKPVETGPLAEGCSLQLGACAVPHHRNATAICGPVLGGFRGSPPGVRLLCAVAAGWVGDALALGHFHAHLALSCAGLIIRTTELQAACHDGHSVALLLLLLPGSFQMIHVVSSGPGGALPQAPCRSSIHAECRREVDEVSENRKEQAVTTKLPHPLRSRCGLQPRYRATLKPLPHALSLLWRSIAARRS
mmetsp:Transcript_20171/g.47014  ORF Transcript_20171/g.47014 Transcript_20171/m.47014 type:complete len:282 (+) Transcript_20171:510-1355(+)